MAKIQIYSLFTEEYGKNLSPKYQYNPNPRFYTPLYRLLTYNHRVMHPRLFSLYDLSSTYKCNFLGADNKQ